jgi:hypothetical protein
VLKLSFIYVICLEQPKSITYIGLAAPRWISIGFWLGARVLAAQVISATLAYSLGLGDRPLLLFGVARGPIEGSLLGFLGFLQLTYLCPIPL